MLDFCKRHFTRICFLLCAGGACVLILILVAFTNIGSAIQIGGDEAFEVTKGLLWSKGYHLYSEVWNDQPPLFTVFLGCAFKIVAPTIKVARSLAMMFGVAFFAAFFSCVKRNCGYLAASFASIWLLLAPTVFRSAVSVMLEVPAFSLTMGSLWLIYCWRQHRTSIWLIASAVIFAAALQIKLTSAVALPALLTEVFLSASDHQGRKRNSILWLFSMTLTFFSIGFVFGSAYGDYAKSHLSAQFNGPVDSVYHFSTRLFLRHIEGIAAAIIGLVIVVRRRAWATVSFPLTMFATALIIHAFHRPWWNYYYLHFAIPITWLSGYGIAALVEYSLSISVRKKKYTALTASLTVLCLNMLAIDPGATRLVSQVDQIRLLPSVEKDPVVALMRAHAGRTTWAFARNSIEPFHARIPIISEIAVLPKKRFWAGLITYKDIVNILEEYNPGQILIKNDDDPLLSAWVTNDYLLVYEDDERRLYIAKRILATMRKSRAE
jgi:hypothetical protein